MAIGVRVVDLSREVAVPDIAKAMALCRRQLVSAAEQLSIVIEVCNKSCEVRELVNQIKVYSGARQEKGLSVM